ncbi:uncharacterized protein LOC112556634 isoform X2 [Pomacea canaliculata]|uniref:uncharacterized protein LOC112556634 isoform X2 n=1 Tax=Pomacea canaliculata TaxID=400727 RepID=UPI000D732D91|nr:uncharacterized protein LOC112556634 isoform X2 [Pomacea canaliculata]
MNHEDFPLCLSVVKCFAYSLSVVERSKLVFVCTFTRVQKMESFPDDKCTLPAAMKELIQYFESQSKLLDDQDIIDSSIISLMSNTSNCSETNFISCIRFCGVPILPPVMTTSRRQEMRQAQQEAMFRKSCSARQKTVLSTPSASQGLEASGEHMEKRGGQIGGTRYPLERPSVLKPVLSSAWGSLTADSSENLIKSDGREEAVESLSTVAVTSTGNTFATIEQGTEEFGFHTLDSVCSDLMSMEEVLPTYFHGVPLTSVRQQKISQDLNRLSKILNVKDFNSTGESDAGELTRTGLSLVGQALDDRWAHLVSTDVRASDDKSSSVYHERQDFTVAEDNVGMENSISGTASIDCSSADMPSQGEVNALFGSSTNTSGVSSANTTSTTDSQKSSRSSPRSLKNTVHFASFVTEYFDNSSSQSSENITVVKKKISADFGGDKRSLIETDRCEVDANQNTDDSLCVTNISSKQNKKLNCSDEGLLCKVSLTDLEAPNSPVTDPSSLPFQNTMSETCLSDKENDAKQANQVLVPGGAGTSSACGHSRQRSGGGPTVSSASVAESQTSSKSDTTAATSESSSSTLIESVVTSGEGMELGMNVREFEPTGKDGDGTDRTRHQFRMLDCFQKPKKLPAEPLVQTAISRTEGRDSTENLCASQGQKAHIRRGSYTLLSPSPVLVRACERAGETAFVGKQSTQFKEIKKGIHEEDCAKQCNSPQHIPSHLESTGKAEHMSRYLSQVQLHYSGEISDSSASNVLHVLDPSYPELNAQLQSSLNVLQSLTQMQSSLLTLDGSEGKLPEEVLEAHSQQFDRRRQTLLTKQKQELEDLFVQQRREQMSLLAEIEEHQRCMKEQQEFLETNLPESIKVQTKTVQPNPTFEELGSEETQIKQGSLPACKFVDHTVGNFAARKPALSSGPPTHRLVLRSPGKFSSRHTSSYKITTPPEALEPHMKVKFDKLTALARGFLTRCLMKSSKVQELIKTIKATREFAFSFQSEVAIARGPWSRQDRHLFERIINQLQAALMDIHEIFFDMPVIEKMMLIKQTRQHKLEKEHTSSREENPRGSGPRISSATLKALKRKQQAQEAEAAVFGETRPSTTSPISSSAQSASHDDLRAIKPITMHASHHLQVSPLQLDVPVARSEKRPQTAPEKVSRPKKPGSTFAPTFSSGHSTDSAFSKSAMRLKQQQQQHQQQQHQAAPSKSSKLPKQSKLWR